MQARKAPLFRAEWLVSAAIGVAAGVVTTGVWWLLYSFGLFTFPPFDLGDLVIHRSPGSLATITAAAPRRV